MHAYVIGNVTIDEMMIVDELPSIGASILGKTGSHDMGGKGTNQAIVMARCGLPTTLIAPVGNDARAHVIRHHLSHEPLTSTLIEIEGAASDMSVIFRLPGGENAIVTTTDAAQSLTLSSIISNLHEAKSDDLMVLQGNLSDTATADILRYAKAIGMVTAFNPSPLRPYFSSLWSLIDIVFLNAGEARVLTGTTGEAAARYLLGKGANTVILTSGSEGALLVDAHQSIPVPATSSDVVDTTGAGDTFMAVALASAARSGRPMDRSCLDHASKAAAITVSRLGTAAAFPTIAELNAIFGELALSDATSKARGLCCHAEHSVCGRQFERHT